MQHFARQTCTKIKKDQSKAMLFSTDFFNVLSSGARKIKEYVSANGGEGGKQQQKN